MAPRTLDATITPGQKPEVDVEEQAVAGLPASGRYPPFSVSLFVIPVRQAAARPAPGPVGAAPAPAAARPNIVLILADDLGFSDVASYGGEIPTPHLDRLAAEGVRFTQFYNAARCSPTRASLLTGRTPHAVASATSTDQGSTPATSTEAPPRWQSGSARRATRPT